MILLPRSPKQVDGSDGPQVVALVAIATGMTLAAYQWITTNWQLITVVVAILIWLFIWGMWPYIPHPDLNMSDEVLWIRGPLCLMTLGFGQAISEHPGVFYGGIICGVYVGIIALWGIRDTFF